MRIERLERMAAPTKARIKDFALSHGLDLFGVANVERFAGAPRAAFLGALQMEGIPCDGLFYEPVYRSALFPVDAREWPALSWGRPAPLDLKSMYHCPVAERAAYEESVWLPQFVLLGSDEDIADIARAVAKVMEGSEALARAAPGLAGLKGMGRADRPRFEREKNY